MVVAPTPFCVSVLKGLSNYFLLLKHPRFYKPRTNPYLKKKCVDFLQI